jgi:hypothetical protein
VGNVSGKAANAVTAHFGLGTIGVKNPHGVVGVALTGQHKNDAIRANAKVAIAQGRGLGGGEQRFGLIAIVDHDEIVAETLIFIELDIHECVAIAILEKQQY